MLKVLIIIPAYNEAENIQKTVDNVKLYNYDVCVINDCSKDNTYEICKADKDIVTLDLPFNLGIGGAVQTGYLYAMKEGYDIVVQLDGDGQHDSSYIKDLIQPLLQDEADMVIGSRFIERRGFQSSAARRVGIKFFKGLISFFYKERITDATSGFRAVNKALIKIFAKSYPADYPEPETNAALLRQGYRVKEIAVMMKSRGGGQSSISTSKSIWYMIKVTTAIIIDYLRGGQNYD
jgi:hypothetical protein